MWLGLTVVLRNVVGPDSTLQNQFVEWGLPPHINTCSENILSDVRLLTNRTI